MDLSPLGMIAIALAAVVAGAVNAVAGGGTLISFPMLTAVGLPSVSANMTNTVGLSPGYFAGAFAQRNDLRGQRDRLTRLLPVAILGAVVGSVLLLNTSESAFRRIVPLLILTGCGLLAAQDRVRAFVEARNRTRTRTRTSKRHGSGIGPVAMFAIFSAAIYGGYFGAGLGIVLLGVLGVVVDDEFKRTNALKQTLSLTINTTAAVRFVFSGQVVWTAVVIMAVGSLAGGTVGGRFASCGRPKLMRQIVIGIGVVVAIVYLVRSS